LDLEFLWFPEHPTVASPARLVIDQVRLAFSVKEGEMKRDTFAYAKDSLVMFRVYP
jgi:hypothetical protein